MKIENRIMLTRTILITSILILISVVMCSAQTYDLKSFSDNVAIKTGSVILKKDTSTEIPFFYLKPTIWSPGYDISELTKWVNQTPSLEFLLAFTYSVDERIGANYQCFVINGNKLYGITLIVFSEEIIVSLLNPEKEGLNI